jgi:hypothetical protein
MNLDEARANCPDGPEGCSYCTPQLKDLILDLRWQLEEAQRTIQSLEGWLAYERNRTVRQLAFDGMEDHE